MATPPAPQDISVTHPERVVFPDDGFTKGDVVGYYLRIAPNILPHLRDRPLTLQRYPQGIGGDGFFQKNTPGHYPPWIPRVRTAKQGGTVDYVLCNDAATLAYLANQSAVTLHVWLSRADALDRPDQVVVDLDPSGPDFSVVRRAALRLRDLLDGVGMASFVKTTGSRGLHVMTPLDRSADTAEVRAFAADVAAELARRHPDELTTEFHKSERAGRLYLDIARNGYAQTVVPAYALRARAGAPVAVPVSWDEVASSSLAPAKWTIANVFRRLGQIDDPWRGVEDAASPIRWPGG